jgi:hypothetical protein
MPAGGFLRGDPASLARGRLGPVGCRTGAAPAGAFAADGRSSHASSEPIVGRGEVEMLLDELRHRETEINALGGATVPGAPCLLAGLDHPVPDSRNAFHDPPATRP